MCLVNVSLGTRGTSESRQKIVFMKLISFILGLVEAAGGICSWKYPNTGKSLWLMMKWSKWF